MNLPINAVKPQQVKDGEHYLWRRMVSGRWEWLTERGWRRVRGGGHAGRRPADVLRLRFIRGENDER